MHFYRPAYTEDDQNDEWIPNGILGLKKKNIRQDQGPVSSPWTLTEPAPMNRIFSKNFLDEVNDHFWFGIWTEEQIGA